MKRPFLVIVALVSISGFVEAQNYTSLADGAWTTPANWNNTSGWGGSTPSLNHSSGTITVNHNMTLSSAASIAGGGLNLAAGKTITSTANFTFAGGTSTINGAIDVTGNFTVSNGTTNIYGSISATGNLSISGGATVNVYGTLEITGDATLNANLRIHPGGQVIVHGNVTVVSSNYLTIGTSTAPPPYADLVIYQNLIQQGSGDVTINRNGRIAIFGNVTDSGGGGTFLRVEDGGQAYVHGDITYSGGGSAIQNNNSTDPYGLYVNGTTTSSGGGGSVTTNLGDQETMQNTNLPFYNWVAGIPDGPLPIVLLYLKVDEISDNGIVLKWVTTFEKNFAYFEIERAGNDLVFTPIGRLDGYGGMDINTTYDYTDTFPLNGKNYYRLKSVDIDGSFEYSPVVLGSWSFLTGVNVYPNPAVNKQFQIRLSDAMSFPAKVQLLDRGGNTILYDEINMESSSFQLSNDVKPGLYFLRISSVSNQVVIKVIVD